MIFGWRDTVPDHKVDALAHSIDTEGYAVVNNYLSNGEIDELAAFAEATVDANGGQYVGLRTASQLNGTVLAAIMQSENFVGLCRRLSDRGLGHTGPEFDLYQVVRFVKGSNGRRVSGAFHYDSYVLTALLPLVMPKDGSGRLLLMRASRKIRRWYFVNMIDKMLVENRYMQRWLRKRANIGDRRIIHLSLIPGNLYLFWGYRSIHTNEPTDPTALRATALFHYGDPHFNSSLRQHIRAHRGLDPAGAVLGADRL
jgi:hypothetical protein